MALRGFGKLVGASAIALLIAGPSLGQSVHDHSRFHTTSQSVNVGVGGDGDIRAQLSWEQRVDLDLHMTQPDHGVHVYYGRRAVTFNNGGATAELDHDNLGGVIDVAPNKRVENIVVSGDNIPLGQYNFHVNNFSGGYAPYEMVIKGNDDGRLVVNNGVLNYRGENSPYYTINFDGTTVSQEVPNIPIGSIDASTPSQAVQTQPHGEIQRDNTVRTQPYEGSQQVSWADSGSSVRTQSNEDFRDGNTYSFDPMVRQLIDSYNKYNLGIYNLGEVGKNIGNLQAEGWKDYIEFINWNGSITDTDYIIRTRDDKSPSGFVNYHISASLNREVPYSSNYRISIGSNVAGVTAVQPQQNMVVATNNILPKVPNSVLVPDNINHTYSPIISVVTGLPIKTYDTKIEETSNNYKYAFNLYGVNIDLNKIKNEILRHENAVKEYIDKIDKDALQDQLDDYYDELEQMTLNGEFDSNVGAELRSLAYDLTPVIGSLKSIGQVIKGEDLVTGEKVNRWEEAAGIVPIGKYLTRGYEAGGTAVKIVKKTDNLADLPVARVLQNQAIGIHAQKLVAQQKGFTAGGKHSLGGLTVVGSNRKSRIYDGEKLNASGRISALESKVGYTSATQRVKEQLAADVALIKNGNIADVTWAFTVSPTTGKSGWSKGVEDYAKQLLESNGLPTNSIKFEKTDININMNDINY